MLNHLTKYQIILASQSPRRRALLKEIIPGFESTTVELEEVFPAGFDPAKAAVFLAEKKAEAFSGWDAYENPLLITADTIVSKDGRILGKPSGYEEAVEMLEFLSGDVHDVITAVCLKSKRKSTSFSVCTKVHFNELSREEINYYINEYKPFDKAGSYGIQEWIGYIGVDKIEGSFYNVMGLPMQSLYRELKQFS